MFTRYIYKNVSSHIEVYDSCNNFIFSADNKSEAVKEVEEMESIYNRASSENTSNNNLYSWSFRV